MYVAKIVISSSVTNCGASEISQIRGYNSGVNLKEINQGEWIDLRGDLEELLATSCCLFFHTPTARKEVQFTSNKRHHALFFLSMMITPLKWPWKFSTLLANCYDLQSRRCRRKVFFHTAQLESFLSLFRR